jgi:hypothetical protein
MIGIDQTQVPGLHNLKKLPKDKLVLDYVLQQLSENSSPEKFELISSFLDMYRTSPGFDPIALSKGRYKRVKSAEIKRLVGDLENDLGKILNSEIYKQLVAKHTNYSPLFQSYLNLSDELNTNPPTTMLQDVDMFETQLRGQEAHELLLSFYRQHHRFFEDTRTAENPELFLQQYDHLVERCKQQSRHVRCGIVLKSLELQFIKGKAEKEKIAQLWEELGALLTLESNVFTKHELLLKIIRCGLLTETPSRNIEPYLIYAEKNYKDILQYNPEDAIMLYSTLAYHLHSASDENKIKWLQVAEHLGREQGQDELRSYFKLIRAVHASEHLDFELGLRLLNEAEHQVHRVPGRSMIARNTWIRICEFKILLYAYDQLSGKNTYGTEEFNILLRLIEDLGIHRHDNAVLVLELKGIQFFVFKNWPASLESFESALNYRKSSGENQYQLMDEFFIALIKNSDKNKETLSDLISKLRALNAPFYSTALSVFLEHAKEFIIANNQKKVN